MKKFKKILAMCMAVVMTMSVMSICTFAADDVPSDLPEGTIKIADGIYMYSSPVMPANDIGFVDIGVVPALGTILQPSAFRNVIVDTGHKYLCIQSSNNIKVNFVRGTQSVFGANCLDWPSIGGTISNTYYIEADYFNIQKGVAYQLQCTSINDRPRDVEQLRIRSSIARD